MAKPKMPGFRFQPTDVELIEYFLKRKVRGKKFPSEIIAELDLYKFAPWDLPDMSLLKNGDLNWYFFCPRGKKYSTGGRLNRATEAGYWKTTGKDRAIEHNNRVVGMIKTLVFHTGRAPKGDRTDWVMHEFRLDDKVLADEGVLQDSYVICRVYQKEGPGPRNGAQYGKPYEEKEWETDEEIDSVQSAPVAAVCAPVPIQPSESHISVANYIHPSTSGCAGLTSVSCVSELMPSCSTHPSAPSNPVGTVSCVSELIPSCSEPHHLPSNNQVGSVSCVSEFMPSCSAHPSAPNSQVGSVSCVSEFMPSCSAHPSAPNSQVGSVSCVSEFMPSCSAHPSAPNSQVGSVSSASELMPSFSDHPSAPNNQVGSVSCVPELMTSCSAHPSAPNNQVDNDILSLLDCFFEDDDTLAVKENNRIENIDDPDQANNADGALCSDPNAIFEELGDLNSLVGLGEGSFSCGQKNEYTTSEMLYTVDIFGSCDHDFLELLDLETPQLWLNKHGSGSQDK
ncbi:NAC domain-containing protein 78 [Glycine soja]|nr:NAC domain-containing protein 78 [Glycine soja]